MNANQELLVGVFLILAGIVLAIFAYVVLTSKEPDEVAEELEAEREAGKEEPSAPEAEVLAGPEASIPVQEEAEDLEPTPDEGTVEEIPEAAGPEPAYSSPEPGRESAVPGPVLSQGEEMPQPVPPRQPAAAAPPPSSRPRIQVATILRDEVTGAIVLKVGDREYTSVEDLKDSPDWTRIDYAATDLNRWLNKKEETAAPVYREPDTGSTRPQSMIGQINDILQRKIAESGSDIKAVQLIEGPGGAVRVLIGVHSYDLGEVPNPVIQKLIRESVAEWESSQ
jgi:hypothetical protein